MFGNRKRKPQDDEESLVPHGLVWHATAEPTPEEAAKNQEVLGYTINYAQEIERARRGEPELPAQAAPVPQAPQSKPAVVPWWRIEQPAPAVEPPVSKLAPMPLSAYVPTPIEPAVEVAPPSRIQPMQIRPIPIEPNAVQPPVLTAAVQPIQAIPSAVPAPLTAIAQTSTPRVEGSLATSVQAPPISRPRLYTPPAPTPQIEDRLVPKSTEITEALALAFSRLRSAGKTVWLNLSSVTGKAMQRGRQTVQSLELGERFAHAGKQGQNLMRGGIAKTSQYARTASGAVGAFSRGGIARVQQASVRLRNASTTSTGEVMRPAHSQSSAPSRVRLAMAASALQARVIAAQRLSAWRMRRERVAIDSRFWASMTMSAIAAIIALVIVSVVPHYAAKSLPSRILNTNPSVNADVASPVAAAPAPVHKTVAPVRKTTTAASTQTTTAKNEPLKTGSSKSAATVRPKHVVDDDYVAPNTYKYYGTDSKASR